MTTTGGDLHPLVGLMHRYVQAYTNAHDQTIYPELFEEDYTVNIGGERLIRDESYGPAVRWLFDRAPGLGITVHEIVHNGDRLAMRFSEHASMPRRDGSRVLTCWRGIGLYAWNGRRLVSNWVEQDFLARRRQLETGASDHLEPPHLDPWMGATVGRPDETAEQVVHDAVVAGELHRATECHLDDRRGAGEVIGAPVVDANEVVVDDLFSAGSHVGVHATYRGAYRGGIRGVDDTLIGTPAELAVVALAEVRDGALHRVRMVTDREGVRGQLLAPT